MQTYDNLHLLHAATAQKTANTDAEHMESVYLRTRNIVFVIRRRFNLATRKVQHANPMLMNLLATLADSSQICSVHAEARDIGTHLFTEYLHSIDTFLKDPTRGPKQVQSAGTGGGGAKTTWTSSGGTGFGGMGKDLSWSGFSS